jgi:16S rRNA G966 N2-methylase RsmD
VGLSCETKRADGAAEHVVLSDNLDVLRHYIPDESVDLIYLDPPFNPNRA